MSVSLGVPYAIGDEPHGLLAEIERELTKGPQRRPTLAKRLRVTEDEIASAIRVGFALGRVESATSGTGNPLYRLWETKPGMNIPKVA